MEWGDRAWDSRANYIWALEPPGSEEARQQRHLVRESSWYALGLLLRNENGDRTRAIQILNAVLDEQYDEPGAVWNGTFYRAPEEPHPTLFARMWDHYDPNWREFIGCTFATILIEYGSQLPAPLVARLETSIDRAVEGEIHEKRLEPSYTNIALMYGFLWSFAGHRHGHQDWIKQSAEWTETVYRLFQQHGSFNEFNSPTYYGVDFYGLALWRVYGPSPRMREMGAAMERALWRDVALFYNANLRNIAGPYDRAYGMDMTSYISVTGVWLRTVLPPNLAPFPELKSPVHQMDDLLFAPLIVMLGTPIPPDAMKHFESFQGEHLVKREITDKRTATAWVGRNMIIGGEITGRTKDCGTLRNQFHPVTVQWKMPDGRIGWIQMTQSPRLDAEAGENSVTIRAIGDSRFRINAPQLDSAKITADSWALPGLLVQVETDAQHFAVAPGQGFVDLLYQSATKFQLKFDH